MLQSILRIEMKKCAYIILGLLLSCSNSPQTNHTLVVATMGLSQPSAMEHEGQQVYYWKGTLNNKIPIFLHYTIDSNLVEGEITYLNTKGRKPIRLLGTIEEDQSYRLLEFDQTGNITGIIEGQPNGAHFRGSWYSPQTAKELSLSLSRADTTLEEHRKKLQRVEVFGDYHYQYGEDGYSGELQIKKLAGNTVEFYILSLTNVERGPNIAEVPKDTVVLQGNSFTYRMPESDSCEFKVRFYRDFAFVQYTKGYCSGQFGLNATVDGIYLKTK